jgi:hypothetical protein
MAKDQDFNIVCYSAWCGAEATYRFADQKAYDDAKAFLDKLTGGGIDGSVLPSGYGDAQAYYFVDSEHRDAFSEFMRPRTR